MQAWEADKPLWQDILQTASYVRLVEMNTMSIATVHGMVDRILLVGAFWGNIHRVEPPPTSPLSSS